MNVKSEPLFFTIKAAAYKLGISYRTLLNAVNAGIVPHYKLQNSRMLVSIPDVLQVMQIQGGKND